MVRVLMVIAQNMFRDEELFDTAEVFESSGYKVDIASETTKEAKGALGSMVKPHLAIKDAKIYEYDAVVIVGGRGAAAFVDNKDVLRLVKDAYDRQKIVAAICLGPMVLAKAGLLKGKKATIYKSNDTLRFYKQEGVDFVDQDVVVAGQIITANGPEAAKKFGLQIAQKILG